MSWFESVSFKTPLSDTGKPALDAAAMAQLGAMSPLWMMFLGASTAGIAYWSMTRWMALATPERIKENVVKLRLVRPAPAPEVIDAPVALAPVAESEIVVPEPEAVLLEPVVAEVASVSVVMPEPVAEAAAAVAPDLVKLVPTPAPTAVAKPAPVIKAAPAKPVAQKAAAKKRSVKIKAKAPIKPAPVTAPTKTVVAKAAPAKAPTAAKAAPAKAIAKKPTAKKPTAKKPAAPVAVKAKPKA